MDDDASIRTTTLYPLPTKQTYLLMLQENLKDTSEAVERQEHNKGGSDDADEYYAPRVLDDPQMTAGRHKQVNTEPYIVVTFSILVMHMYIHTIGFFFELGLTC